MRQQVNLYQPAARTQQQLLAASTVAWAGAMIIVALLAIWGYGLRKVARLDQAVAALRAQQQQQSLSINAAGALNAAHADPAALAAAVATLQGEVSARTRALQLLRSGAAGQASGFAARLEALARRHVEGLWIDEVVLSGTTGSMSVRGETLDPNLVPRYLRSLAQEAVLAGTRFDEFAIERPQPEGATADGTASPATKARGQGQIHFHATSSALRAAAMVASS